MHMTKVKVLRSVPVKANEMGSATRQIIAGTDDEVPSSEFESLKAGGYVDAFAERSSSSGPSKDDLVKAATERGFVVPAKMVKDDVAALLKLADEWDALDDAGLAAAAVELKIDVAEGAARTDVLAALKAAATK